MRIFHFFISAMMLIGITIEVKAQPPQWQWVRGGGGNGPGSVDETSRMMGVDDHGNTYIAINRAQEDFMVDTFYRSNYTQASFIISYACDGKLRWVKEIGGNGYGEIYAFTVGNDGSCYFYGATGGNPISWPMAPVTLIDTLINFPSDSFTLAECIVKLDSNGHRVWQHFPGASFPNYPPYLNPQPPVMRALAMDLDTNKNLHIILNSPFTAGTTVDTNYFWMGCQIRKPALHRIILSSLTGLPHGSMKKMEYESVQAKYFTPTNFFFKVNQDKYFIGYYNGQDSLNIGSHWIITTGVSGVNNAYYWSFSRFDTNGNYEQHIVSGGLWINITTMVIEPFNMTFHSGKMYNTGYARHGIVVYGDTLKNVYYDSFSAPNVRNSFVVCRDALDFNNVHWVSQISRKYHLTLPSINVNPKNNQILVADVNASLVLNNGDTLPHYRGLGLYALDAVTGKAQWGIGAKRGISSSNLSFESMAIDKNGNIFVGGTYNDSLYDSYGNGLYFNGGSEPDFFVAKVAFDDQCECNTGPLLPVLLDVNGNTVTVKGVAWGNTDSLKWYWGDGSSALYQSPDSPISHTYLSGGNYSICLAGFNACGITDSCLTLMGLDVHNLPENYLEVYPNPASHIISVRFPSTLPISLKILDIQGNILWQKRDCYQEENIDISQLKPGMYILEGSITNGQRWLRKIVKE